MTKHLSAFQEAHKRAAKELKTLSELANSKRAAAELASLRKRVERECLICGTVKPMLGFQKFCSSRCRKAFSRLDGERRNVLDQPVQP